MKKIIFIFLSITILGLLLFSNISSFRVLAKNLLNDDTKIFIKKIFFGKEYIEEVDFYRSIFKNQKVLPETEFQKMKLKKIKISSLDILEQTHLDKLYNRQSNVKRFFIDIIDKNILLTTVKGNFFLIKDVESNNRDIKKINSNISSFGNISVLDAATINEKIYISYFTDDLEKKGCSHFYINVSDLNNQQLEFKQIFKSTRCNVNNYGGRIVSAKIENKNGILFSTGATGDNERHFAQDKESHLGKILFKPFDSISNSYEIISSGHRNPQGLYSDSDVILSTEHGPYGGDEINKIEKGKNYGWPISSYGEKYGFLEKNELKFDYKKSHSKNGFKEPIFSFVPSIGISEIIKIPDSFSKYWKNNFFISSLNGVSLYRVEFDQEYEKINYKEKIIISERIRDIKYLEKNNIFLLSLETSGSLGILKSFD